KFYSLTGHVYSATMLVANDDFFASMPEDLWKIVEDAGKRYVVEQRALAEVQEQEFLEELKKTGLQINELTPEEKQLFIDATLPAYDQFKDVIGAELVELAKKANEE
ncbi:MAG TPA: C4-dicarboxylate ABC transporter substrate-binding protein, partial [Synergistales bacterium]|nr:C4-dicarboxylate ABC transporter substrate-binding protein [Synergistales bacterium]